MSDQYYKKFNIKSKIITDIAPSLITADLWEKHYGLDLIVVSDKIWHNESLLRIITQKFPISAAVIIRSLPNNVYNWHIDGIRSASINLKLSIESQSHTLFGEPLDDWNDKFVELDYDSDTFYLFNTQHRHCVINFDKYRYLFSIQFAQTKDEITYKEIYDWCSSEGLF